MSNNNKVPLYWREFLQDHEGNLSFKRLQTIVYLFLFVFLFFANLFWGLMVADMILEFLLVLNMFSYTGVISEVFTKRKGLLAGEVAKQLHEPQKSNVEINVDTK